MVMGLGIIDNVMLMKKGDVVVDTDMVCHVSETDREASIPPV